LPTWNYVSVHAEGTLSVERDARKNLELLRETAVRLSGAPSDFRVEDSDPRVQKWIHSIRGVSIEIERIEGRFKLSQDKSPADVEAAAAYLLQQNARRIPLELLLALAGLPTTKRE
jgi:transcriptional regulator